MFNFIKNRFPCRAKYIRDFIEVVRREGCKSIVVKPYTVTKHPIEFASVGTTGDFQYILEVTARTPGGRKVVYRKKLIQRSGSNRGLADANERRCAALKLFLTGEQNVTELRTKLPGVSVDLIDPKNQIMDEKMYAQLHKDAAAYGVSV